MRNALQSKRLNYAVLILAGALAVAAGAAPAHAQGFNLQNFSSTASLTLKGNAAQASGNILRLNPASTSQVGAAWFTNQVPVRNGFTTVFQFRISNASLPVGNFPADGIAFVVQNSSVNELGDGGGGIGYQGILNSLAVEFDTFQNGPIGPNGETDNNHVAVQSCGTATNTADHRSIIGCNLGLQTIGSPIFADGSVHTVVINYDPPTCGECLGTLKVYLDSNTPVLTVGVDLNSKLILAEGGKAWVGLTGATGALVENNDILNWSFTPHVGTTTNAILSFTPGDNVSQTATFGPNTTDPNAHSINLKLKHVNTPFTLIVSATEVDGNGKCESGVASDTDIDCRFVTYFGTPSGSPPAVTVPLCVPYTNSHCVYYRVENPPAGSAFVPGVLQYIAWNLPTGPSVSGYANNPQMYDDPSNPPFDANHQFVRNITTFFNPGTGQVGTDPGVGGSTDDFNDFVIAYPPLPPNLQFILLPPLTDRDEDFERGSTIPVKFKLKMGNIFINNAATAPNHIGIVVLDSNGVRQPINPNGGQQAFTFNGNHYKFNLNTSPFKPGKYSLIINSNLFMQQTIPITIEHGGHE